MKFNEFMGALRKGPLKHVYLLSGVERYYIDKAKERILELLFPEEGSRDGALLRVSHEMDLDELIGTVETAPFFSDKNVVLLENTTLFREKKSDAADGADGKKKGKSPQDKKLDRLVALLSDMPDDSYLIFVTSSKADKRKKLYKAVEKAGAVLEAEPVRAWNVNDWLQGKLQSMNRELDREAYAYFANAVSMMQEISLGYLDQEFDKLALYAKDRRISKREIMEVFSGLPEVSLFALMDAISEKNAGKALGLLERQLSDGTYEPLILSLLVRHVRQLWQARLLMAEGIRGKELAKPLELNPFIAEKLGKSAAKFSDEQLRQVFLQLADADYEMKTGQAGAELLEHAVIRLCQPSAANSK